MHEYYDSREEVVKKCIEQSKREVEELQKKEQTPFGLVREKNYNLRVYQQELEIEKICRTRTQKVFLLFYSKFFQIRFLISFFATQRLWKRDAERTFEIRC